MTQISVLHIGCLDGDPSAGAEVAILNHIEHQADYCKLIFLNCGDYKLNNSNARYCVINCDKDLLVQLDDKFWRDIDVAIFHCIYYPIYLKIAHKLRRYNIPYIVIPHGGLQVKAQNTKRIKRILGNTLFFNSFLKKATAIQYLCEAEKMNSVIKNDRAFISGNGYDVGSYKKKYNDVKKEGLKIIYIGRYDIYFKGLDVLLDSVLSICDYMRDNNIKLFLYGKKNSEYDLLMHTIKKNNIDDIVYLNDGIFGKEKIGKLLEADVFIQTSRSEGQPLAIIEAISLGLPCIVTEGTNFGSIIKNENIGWVAEFTQQSIINAIKEANIHKNELQLFSDRAYNYALKELSWSKVSQEALGQYAEIIRKQKNRRDGCEK